ILRLILGAFVAAALFQTGVAIVQYFYQEPLGLRLLGETATISAYPSEGGSRWLFDQFFPRTLPSGLRIIRGTPLERIDVIRASGTFPHANVLGGFLALSLLATYYLILQAKKGKILLGLTLPFQFFAMMLSFSRSALFGWALGSGLWFALMLYKRQRVQFVGLMVAISVAMSGLLLFGQIRSRGGVVNYNHLAKLSDQVRVTHTNTSMQIIKDHPFLGLGFAQFSERAANYIPSNASQETKATAPHNIYLFLACETGLISAAALLLFVATLLFAAFRAPITAETATLSSAFIAFLFIGCCDFYPILHQQGKLMFFIIAGLLSAYVHGKKWQPNLTLLNDPSRRDVWKMFDAISATYDRTNRVLSLGMDQRWRKQVARSLPNRPHLTVLDLATGTGDQIVALLKSKASIESVTGIDLSNEMLEIAKMKLKERATFLRADAEKLPFPNESFDAATFSFGIRNVVNPLLSLKDIYRVLKPKGRCLILEFSLPPQPIRGFYLFYLRTLLPKIGGFLSRNPAAYRYLNKTIEHFPSGKAFSALMEKAGFKHLERIPMSFGGVTLYVGEKQ
ncbi:MAG TPA: bifunctional demethylmenaquinone methyltransferase/2-methoxy-6-polyprenyl-1,4-benzoquinol methylase UbiE, partial [Chlamydiales bacterium]|nr:bifunctional demethylmenaquinone methyltransferase/2-methoxy-6-polyprenyl-1,4-benzoquinol methylase UbiE [Chlamydiales bacterium]